MTPLRRLAVGGACLALVAGGTTPPARAAVDPDDPNVVVRRITVPIQGSFSDSDDFGDPRGSGIHEGNDLMAPKGRPLLAVVDATVRRIFVDNGTASQGNMLVLRDSEGWEYWYIHINNDTPGTDDGLNPLEHAFAPGIAVGAKVKAGQVVAFAGDSGNAESTGSHLHFEIHQPGAHGRRPLPQPAAGPGPAVREPLRLRHQPDARAGGGVGTGLLAPRRRRRRVLLRRGRLLRLDRRDQAEPAGGGHGRHHGREGLLVRRHRRRGLHLRVGVVLRVHRRRSRLNQPIVGMAATPTGRGLLARRPGRRHLRLRRRRLLRLDRRR